MAVAQNFQKGLGHFEAEERGMTKTPSKLELRGGRVDVEARHVTTLIAEIFNRLGCPEDHSTALSD